MTLKILRFGAGFLLECAMLGMLYLGIEISPFVLALPFGLMGYDVPDLLKMVKK